MESAVVNMLEGFYSVLWGIPAMLLIVGTGFYLSVRTGFVQIRLFPRCLRLFSPKASQSGRGEASAFQALWTALAASIGIGNLVGVAGAICLGGPGAVFWMLICAFFGMAVKFAEAVLAVRFQSVEAGERVGGVMYMIRSGLGPRWQPLAAAYSLLGIVASFGVGNLVQMNTIVTGITSLAPRVSPACVGALLALLVGAAFAKGAASISQATQWLVPFAAGAYVIMCMVFLICRASAVGDAFRAVFQGAFSPKAVTGGIIGSVMKTVQTGCSRGIFSNEAGMGTASMAHGSARVLHPGQQGLMGILEVFLDTFVVCTLTALVILCSGLSLPFGRDPGASLPIQAFSVVYGRWGSVLVISIFCFFAFSTILGWGMYGLRCAQFLFGRRAAPLFFALQIIASFAGSFLKAPLIWRFSEVLNGCMTIPNLFVLLRLSPELIRLTKEYLSQFTGGHYANFHQCKPLRTIPHAEVPSTGR